MKKVLLLVFILILSCIVLSENKDLSVNLGEIVINGQEFESTINNTPKNITIITKEDIQNSSATSVLDIFKSIANVNIIDYSGNGKSGKIDLRGQGEASGNNVLVLIDGISVNSIDMSGPDFSTVDIDQIERIEVIPSGSVIYGDKALGGVIKIYTKNSEKNGLSGNLKSEYGSFDYKKFGGSINFKNNLIDTSLNANVKGTNGFRNNSNYDSQSYIFKTNFTINKENTLGFKITSVSDDFELPGTLTRKEMKEDPTQSLYTKYFYDENFNFLGSERIDNPGDNGSIEELNYSVNYVYEKNNFKIENIFNYKDRESKTEMLSWSSTEIKIENDSFDNKFKVNYKYKNLDTIYGIDFLNSKSKTKQDEVKKINIGEFILIKYIFNDLFTFNTGYRNENIKLDYERNDDNNDKKDYNISLFESSINYNYSKFGSAFLSFNQGFRSPTTDEYLETYPSVNYNESLEPQKSDNFELGLKHTLGGIINFKGSIFKTITNDEIFYNPITYHNENMEGKTERSGFEIKLNANLNKYFSTTHSFSSIKTKIKDGVYKDKEVPGVPSYKLSFGANITPIESIKFNILYTSIGTNYAISDFYNLDKKTNTINVLDLKLAYNVNKSLSIYSGINNILDKEYSQTVVSYGYGYSYYPSAERNYNIGVSYSF